MDWSDLLDALKEKGAAMRLRLSLLLFQEFLYSLELLSNLIKL